MPKKDKKKKAVTNSATSSSQANQAPSSSFTATEDDVFNTLGLDDYSCMVKKDDIPLLTKLILCYTKPLGRIATEFLENFINRCQLSFGSSLVLLHNFFLSIDDNKDTRYLLPRVVIIYLVYRVRDLEPWMKRKSEKNKNNLQGHSFMEFLLNLASGYIPSMCYGKQWAVHPVEMKFSRMILGKRGNELTNMTANEVLSVFSKVSFVIPDPTSFINLSTIYEKQKLQWPNDIECHSYPALLATEPYAQNGIIYRHEQLETIAMHILSAQLGTTPLLSSLTFPETVPIGMAIWEKTFNKEIRECRTIITERRSEIEMDGEATAVVELVEQIVDEEQIPTTSFLFQDVIQKLLEGETISQHRLNLVYEYICQAPDTDEFFEKLTDFHPFNIIFYIEQNVKFASELIFRLVKMDKSKIFIYIQSMMEMAFSVQCVEIVLRLYRSIPDLHTEILLDYFNTLMSICNITTSSSQKARYVRIFSSFVITILNEGILSNETSNYARNCFQQIQEFALRNNEYKESTGLFQRIQEVLRKWNS